MNINTRTNEGKKRVNFYMPEHFVDELDRIAVDCGVNRTSLINMIIKQYLDQQELLKLSRIAELERNNK